MDRELNDDHEADWGGVVTLLRRTLEVRADDVAAGPPAVLRDPRRATGRPASKRWIAAAACVLVAAGATGVVTYRAVAPDDEERAVNVPRETPEVAAPPPTDPAEAISWYLPDQLPPGYELTDIAATLQPADELPAGGGQQTWLHKDEQGVVVDWVTAHAGSALGIYVSGGRNASVHGVEATTWQHGTGDDQGWSVDWVEDGTLVTIQASNGISEEMLLAIAEASIVADGTVTLDSASLPEGFALVPASPMPAGGEPIEAVNLVISPTGDGGAMWATVTNASFGPPTDVDGVQTVDGVEYAVRTGQPDSLGPFTAVVWEHGGRHFELSGRVEVDTAMAVATSLAPATRDEAAAAAAVITARAQALPVLGTAVFADGVTVSVHGPRTGELIAVAICVDELDTRCVRPTTEATLAGSGESMMYEVFTVDGERRILGWLSDTPVIEVSDGTTPELVASDAGSGYFVSVPVAAGEPIPSIIHEGRDDGIVAVIPTEVIRP